ncbi:MAG: RagB/SusD family nutrient uptake outer membrane protein, partial [Pedobacter sp.]
SLQARAFLYQKKYVEAEAAATKVIDQSSIYSLGILESVFLKNSSETIWALQPVNVGVNTHEAGVYLLPADGPNNTYPVYTSSYLMNSFEVGDDRKNKWMGSVTVKIGANTNTYPYPAKYKAAYNPGGTTVTEYTIVLRLAEQYLIRAEARNEQGNSSGAAADLNTLRAKRRTVPTVLIPNPLADFSSSLTQNDLRIAVIHERQVELFTEWGHRWLDLKRTNRADEVLSGLKPNWRPTSILFPIPQTQILLNPSLLQNDGYQQ